MMREFFQEQYENLADWVNGMAGFTLKMWVWTAAMLGGMSIGSLVGWMNTKIEMYVWSPSITFIALSVCCAINWVTGIILARNQGRYKDKKLLNGVAEWAAYVSILALAKNWGASERTLSWMPEATMVPIVLIVFLKLLRNFSALGVIPKGLAEFLSKKIESKAPDLKENTDAALSKPPAEEPKK